MRRHVVVAPDKFRGSLTAVQAADRIALGVRRRTVDVDVRVLPLADGGEGSVAAAVAAGYREVRFKVGGPTGAPTPAAIAVAGETAFIEAAQASGLHLLPGGVMRPLTASTWGTGELVREAVALGCRRVVLGVRGLASIDGGAGMVQALGARLLDENGAEVPPGGAALARLSSLDVRPLARVLDGVDVVVATDGDGPLLGDRGAAAVHGPPTGASPQDVAVLDSALGHWADLVAAATRRDPRSKPGAGAAGGLGFGAMALLRATTRPGIGLLLDLLGLDHMLCGAGLVITGAGCLDEQTLRERAPARLLEAAAAQGVPVAAVGGRVELTEPEWRAAGLVAALSLVELAGSAAHSIERAGVFAELAGELLAQRLLGSTWDPGF